MKPKTSPGPRRDVVTLADLAPQRRVTGGSDRRVFGADPPKKDLSAGKDVKAGKKAK
jgi:hypothetical protein